MANKRSKAAKGCLQIIHKCPRYTKLVHLARIMHEWCPYQNKLVAQYLEDTTPRVVSYL